MSRLAPSALVIDQGRRVLLRIGGRLYEVTQEERRAVLGLPAGPPGLGITIDGNRLCFEFGSDDQEEEISADQLQRRLAKQLTGNAFAGCNAFGRGAAHSRPPSPLV
jgi:hypothetical protein